MTIRLALEDVRCAVRSPALASVLDAYNALRGDRLMPSLGELVADAALGGRGTPPPSVALLGVSGAGYRVLRLGDEVARAWGLEGAPEGAALDDLPDAERLPRLREALDLVRDVHGALHEGMEGPDGEGRRWELLLLPLGQEEDGAAEGILVVLDAAGSPADAPAHGPAHGPAHDKATFQSSRNLSTDPTGAADCD